jgi:hypothetical protein
MAKEVKSVAMIVITYFMVLSPCLDSLMASNAANSGRA